MNPLTHLKQILTPPAVIALAVVLAGLMAVPVGAAPPQTCGLTVAGLIDPNNPNQAAQFAEIMSYAKIGDWKQNSTSTRFNSTPWRSRFSRAGGWAGTAIQA
jgi:hypothetical protein